MPKNPQETPNNPIQEEEIKHSTISNTTGEESNNDTTDDKNNQPTPKTDKGKGKQIELSPKAQYQLAKFEKFFNPVGSLIKINPPTEEAALLNEDEKYLSDYVDINATTEIAKEIKKNKLHNLTDEEKETITNSFTGLDKILFRRLAKNAGTKQNSKKEAILNHSASTVFGILPYANIITNNLHQALIDRLKKRLEQSFSVREVVEIITEYQKEHISALPGLRNYMCDSEKKHAEKLAEKDMKIKEKDIKIKEKDMKIKEKQNQKKDLKIKGIKALNNYRTEKSQFQQTINQEKTKADNAQKKNKELTAKIQELKETIKALSQEKTKADNAQKKDKESTTKIQELEETIKTLNQEKTKADNSQKENKELKAKIQELEETIKTLRFLLSR